MTHRILVVALECADPIFSGNGVYGRSLALALARRADVACVHVVCALSTEPGEVAPVDAAGRGCVWTQLDQPVGPRDDATAVRICAVPVPAAKWRRLDWHAPCAEFCRGLDGLFQGSPAHTPERRLQLLFDWFTISHGTDARQTATDLTTDDPAAAVESTAPYTHVLMVDWTGAIAAEALLCDRLPLETTAATTTGGGATTADPSPALFSGASPPRVAYLNFRVFSTESLVPDAAELAYYVRVEQRAIALAPTTIALCPADAKALEVLWKRDAAAPPRAFLALPPPIRRDVAALAMAADVAHYQTTESDGLAGSATTTHTVVLAEAAPSPITAAVIGGTVSVSQGVSGRHEAMASPPAPASPPASVVVYLTCMVRLDPTKSAMRFVDLVEALVAAQRKSIGAAKDASVTSLVSVPEHPALRVVPFLCGAAADPAYAESVRARLRNVCPFAVIEERFMTPAQMAPVLRRAAVNAHPCLYDAYAMTIVEAAAFGVPSLVHGDPLTGASDVGAAATLMRSSEQEVVLVDWAASVGPGPSPPSPTLVAATTILLQAQAAVAARRCGLAPPLEVSDTVAVAAERMSTTCRQRALSYTEEDVAAELLRIA